MGTDNNLRRILNRQKEVLTELESEVKSIENSDLTRENERLRTELEKLNMEYAKSAQGAKALSDQNANLKNALHEQIYNEKVKIVNSSKAKLDVYFKNAHEGEANRLTTLENSIRSKIQHMASMLRRNNVNIKDDVYQKLDELSMYVNHKVTEARSHFAQSQGAYSQFEHAEFERLKSEQITDEQIQAVAKKNNIERFVGLNLLNVLGIFLIIIGVITAARFTLVYLPDLLKGVLMFVLGAAMLVAGEIMNRKKPNIFSLGITAGGVGVLYVALATSYFVLEILDMYPALGLCVLITAVAFFLSTRYNAQTVLAFALIGGYLPIFSIQGSLTLIYGAMVYFVVLNLLALIVSFRKKWAVSAFIGLFLNTAGTFYICLNFSYSSALHEKVIAILFILFAFLNYTMIPIISTYSSKSKFKKRDIVLLAINSIFSSFLLFAAFYAFRWEDFTGILAIVFAAVYLLLGRFIERKFETENNTQALFYLTGFAFVVLVIPFQFGRAWLTLGWLAEGVALTAYGILREQKNFKRAGFIINALCLFAFLCFDVPYRFDQLFDYKYLAITAGSLIVLGAYMYKRVLSSVQQKVYKYAVIVNLWIYTIYICSRLDALVEFPANYNITYLKSALAIALTFAIAYIAPRIKMLSDWGTKIISLIIYVSGIVWLFTLNQFISPIYTYYPSEAVIGIVVLVIISLLSVFAMHDLLKLVVMERKLGVEWYPLIVSGYFVLILTQNLITQFHLAFASAWISIIYVLTALAWIIIGFARRYSFIRKFGLGLALLSVVKLILIDLSSLTSGYRIISYFALGITLVAISFVYQYFSKRLELKLEVADDVSENN